MRFPSIQIQIRGKVVFPYRLHQPVLKCGLLACQSAGVRMLDTIYKVQLPWGASWKAQLSAKVTPCSPAQAGGGRLAWRARTLARIALDNPCLSPDQATTPLATCYSRQLSSHAQALQWYAWALVVVVVGPSPPQWAAPTRRQLPALLRPLPCGAAMQQVWQAETA